MVDVLAPVLLLGALAYVLHRLVKSPHLLAPRKGLPSHRLTRPDDSNAWTVEREGWTLSLSTTALNSLPAVLVKGRNHNVQSMARLLYDLGVLAGVIGALIGVGGAMWSTMSVWKEVWREAELHARLKSETAFVVKRSMEAVGMVTAGPGEGNAGVEPIIPGVTVPFSHLPTLVLAFVVNQLIHELGHAISGALDEVQMTRFAFSLHGIFPSASVSFPSSVDLIPTRAKLRLTTSGAAHNLATYITLFLLGSSGMSRLFWADRSADGITVQSIAPTSPLYGHLRPGDLITHVDDVFLGGARDTWEQYLQGSEVGDDGRGWCVDRNVYMARSNTPCAPGSGTIPFEPVDPMTPNLPKNSVKCLQTHPLLQIPSTSCPCPSSKWICVHPRHEEQILRIRVAGKKTGEGGEGVILFSGEREEVMDGLVTGVESARFLGGLVRWESLFLQYMSIVAMSLFIFNLLPLPHTDGSSLLRSLLSLYRSSRRSEGHSHSHSYSHTNGSLPNGANHISSPKLPMSPMKATLSTAAQTAAALQPKAPSINLSRQYELNSDDEDDYDMERGGDTGGGERKKEEAWKRRLRRVIEGGMVGVGALWIAGWAMLSLLRSS